MLVISISYQISVTQLIMGVMNVTEGTVMVLNMEEYLGVNERLTD